ncbi:MAG TPA: CARDB domain-containing protein, partial [Lacipirellula sp.]
AVSRILDQARGRSENQIVTLLRFSEAKNLAAGAGPEIDRRPLDAELMTELDRFLGSLDPSESDAGPVEALQAANRLPDPTLDETRIAYLLTDFRRPHWEEHAQLRQLIGRLRERVGKLLLVQCVYDERPNLAITRLAPEFGIRAAGVETWMEVTVANYGEAPASAVTVAVEQDGARLPAVEIDEIPPGEEATRRFRVTFPNAGAHQLTASLESDAVETDNVRYFAADIPAMFPVLIVDGSTEGDDGRYLRTALDPGGRKAAGWSPQVEPPSFLRQHEELSKFAAICLLDVPRLDDAEVAALEEYVKSGGGLAIFLGGQTQPRFYNERLYRNGVGLLPAPLNVPSQLLRDADEAAGDVRVTDHPIFRIFAGQRNSFLAVARVNFYYALQPAWSPPESGNARIIARVRNGAPLSLEKEFGDGRVIVHLCKLSPRPTELGEWSNLAVNPVFPVFANELVGYLSATQRRFDDYGVDEPVRLTIAEADYQPEVRIRAPGVTDGAAATVVPAAANGQYVIEAPGKPQSGVWQFDLTTRDGKPEMRYAAVNVAPGEGELDLLEQAELAERLRGVDYEFSLASEFSEAQEELAGVRLSDALLYALAGVLIAEQLFAVAVSYHPGAERRAA